MLKSPVSLYRVPGGAALDYYSTRLRGVKLCLVFRSVSIILRIPFRSKDCSELINNLVVRVVHPVLAGSVLALATGTAATRCWGSGWARTARAWVSTLRILPLLPLFALLSVRHLFLRTILTILAITRVAQEKLQSMPFPI